MPPPTFRLVNTSCYGLEGIAPASLHALITDPPYGISYQNNYWDADLPDPTIWSDALATLRPGAFGAVFSSVRLMHRLMCHLEDSGFLIRDVVFWAYLNGMPKSRNIALDIDRVQGVASTPDGTYQYAQGYQKGGAETYTHREDKPRFAPASELGQRFRGAGINLKPAYEPIILVQKPVEKGLNIAQNIIRYGCGALNLEATRIPFEVGERKVGHQPHPYGRVPANIIRTEPFNDGYDKFFLVPKVRQHAEAFNSHPTLKPVALMTHLVKLLTFEHQTLLDPFMGSGSTGVAALENARQFIGYERDAHYFTIAEQRIQAAAQIDTFQ